MPQLETVVDSGVFRTSRLTSAPERVDRRKNVIFGVKVMQLGDLNEGDARNWTTTEATLSQLIDIGSKSANGMKSRFTHPNMSADGLGSHLGRLRDFRRVSDAVIADLHIADAAFKAPQGDLATYVMELAEEDPESFGLSVAGVVDREAESQFSKSAAGRNGEKWPIKWKKIRAADVVDDPAATRGGLFDLTTPDLRNLPAQATALLSTYFGDASEEVVRGRIDSFLTRYFSTKKDEQMAEETPVKEETPETQPAAETPATIAAEPVADLSAAGAEGVTTTVTTDFAAVERERCKKIRALVDLAGVPEKFNTFVDNNFTIDEVQFALREIVSKKNPSLSQVPEQTQKDPDADLKAEYAECVKFKVTMGLTEAEYIANARRKTA